MSAKKKAAPATSRAAKAIKELSHRLYDLENLLNTVAKATRDEDNDTEGSMQIACREIGSLQVGLEGVAKDLEAVQS